MERGREREMEMEMEKIIMQQADKKYRRWKYALWMEMQVVY
jgi:hypothetical protein